MPLRLLLVIPAVTGGAGVYCRLLADALNRTYPGEFEARLLVLDGAALTTRDRAAFAGIEEVGRPARQGWRLLNGPLAHARPVRDAIRRARPDVLLTVGTYANVLVPRLAPAIPSILTEHVNVSARSRHSRFGPLLRTAVGLGYGGGPVVAPSRGVAEDLRQLGVADVREIPHGIDGADLRRRADEPADDLPTTEPYAVACGRLSLQKNYPMMLRAFAAARAAGTREHLVIVGDGEDRQSLEVQAAGLGLAEVVHFVGHRENPFPYLRRARFLVLSSRWEGLPLVPIETMSLGVPCVATDCPSGPAEILADGRFGLLTPPGDEPALARAIRRMSDDKARQAFAEAARRRADDFSPARMAAGYRGLIHEVARTPAPGTGD